MKLRWLLLITIAGCWLTACNNNNNITTRVNSNGSCERILTATVDEKFINGDTADQPFPVDLYGWSITWIYKDSTVHTQWPEKNWKKDKKDSAEIITAFAVRQFKSTQELSDSFRFKSTHPWHNIPMKARFRKQFRWFYTYYTFQEKFSELPVQLPVPVNKYLTKDEAGYWFSGMPDISKGMNGIETKELLDQLESKVNKWGLHNLFEYQYAEVMNNLTLFPINPGREKMLKEKDSVFAVFYKKYKDDDGFNIGAALDAHFKTQAFGAVFKNDNAELNKITEPPAFENLTRFFDANINYKLLMPGKMVSTDGVVVNDTLSWKIDAYRLLNGTYEITVVSRKLNFWFILFSGLVVLGAILLFVRSGKK